MIESESSSNQKEQDVILPDVIMPNKKVGDDFDIILPRGGCYDWHYEMTPSLGLEFVLLDYIIPDTEVGALYTVFTFEAVATGKYIITFTYKNSENLEELPVKTLVYEITVK